MLFRGDWQSEERSDRLWQRIKVLGSLNGLIPKKFDKAVGLSIHVSKSMRQSECEFGPYSSVRQSSPSKKSPGNLFNRHLSFAK
jgi:hypothetical protein